MIFVGAPHPGLPRRDPMGLRLLLLLLLALALLDAGGDAPARIGRALAPEFGPLAPALPARVTPPLPAFTVSALAAVVALSSVLPNSTEALVVLSVVSVLSSTASL